MHIVSRNMRAVSPPGRPQMDLLCFVVLFALAVASVRASPSDCQLELAENYSTSVMPKSTLPIPFHVEFVIVNMREINDVVGTFSIDFE